MAVCVSGVVFAELLFKLKSALGDAEGFLLGQVQRRQVERITDSQSAGTSEERTIFVHSFLCCPEKFSFYDYHGRLYPSKMEDLLGEKQEEVVGWFSYRRGASHRLSLREKAMHRQLRKAFDNLQACDFTLALLTEQAESGVLSTHYSLFQWTGSSPHTVQLNVVNLRAAVPYHTLPLLPLPHFQHHFSTVLKEHCPSVLNVDTQTQPVEELYRAITTRIQPLVSELQQSSALLQSVSDEVQRLQEEVDSREREVSSSKSEVLLIDLGDSPPGTEMETSPRMSQELF